MNRPGHGPNDFEDRLRAALRRRADEVTPDPRLWGRVQERAARPSMRWLGAAATVAPLLAAVCVAVALGLPDRRAEVDLAEPRPAAMATGAAPSATPVAPTEEPPPPTSPVAPPPAREETATAPTESREAPSGGAPEDRVLVLATSPGLVVSDASARAVDVVVTDRASQPGECGAAADCEAEVVSDIRARPGSSATDITVTFLESFGECLGEAGYAIRVYEADLHTDAGAIAVPDDLCPSAPVWSPDGTRIAWLERSADGGLELVTVPFEDDPVSGSTPAPQSRAAIASEPSVGALGAPRIVDWATDAAGAPVLYVTGDPTGEGQVLFSLPVTTGGAGVEPTGPLVPVSATGDESRYLTYASGGEPGPAYLINRLHPPQGAQPTALELVLSAAGDGSEAAPPAPALDLPPELVDPAAPYGERVWLRAQGGEVLFGDGIDQAWRVRWDGTAWSPLEALEGTIRSADFLDLAGS